MLNRIIIMGRLGRDPELRYTQAGKPVASFSLAVDRDFKDKASGERATDWIPVVAWEARAKFAQQYKDMPCLAYTHLQPAQLTTVGKRATLWINELLMDEQEIEARIKSLKLLGSKGTTGTQASFMELFNGDEEKCKKAEQMICLLYTSDAADEL